VISLPCSDANELRINALLMLVSHRYGWLAFEWPAQLAGPCEQALADDSPRNPTGAAAVLSKPSGEPEDLVQGFVAMVATPSSFVGRISFRRY
jgi:hypothetical protein